MDEKILEEGERELDYAILDFDSIKREHQKKVLEEAKKELENTTKINLGNDQNE